MMSLCQLPSTKAASRSVPSMTNPHFLYALIARVLHATGTHRQATQLEHPEWILQDKGNGFGAEADSSRALSSIPTARLCAPVSKVYTIKPDVPDQTAGLDDPRIVVVELWVANWQLWHKSPLWCSLAQIGRVSRRDCTSGFSQVGSRTGAPV